MRKSIAAVLTAFAMVLALVVPMTAFADDGANNYTGKKYAEKYTPSEEEPEYDVVVEDFEEEEVDTEDEEVVVEEEEVTVVVEDEDIEVEVTTPAVDVKGASIDLANGEYDIDYNLTGGAWKLALPAKLFVKDGKSYARLTFNNPDLEKIVLNGKEILPTKWVNVDGIKGKLPVFDLPILAFGAAQGFNLFNKNGDVESYKLSLKDYDPNFVAPAFNADIDADGEKVLNYVDSNNGAHHVLSPKDTRVANESNLKIGGPLAIVIAELAAGAGLLFAGRRKKND